MSKLDAYFAGYKTVQQNGAALPQRATINVIGSAVDNPGNASTDIQCGIVYPLTNPSVQGTSSFGPTPTQLAAQGIVGSSIVSEMFGGSGSTTVLLFPMPGQTGAPFAAGGIHVDVLHRMTGRADVGGLRQGATFKSSASWTVSSNGVVTAEQTSAAQPVAIGTSAGSPPVGWTSTLQLNAGSTSTEVVIVGGSTDSAILAQVLYSQ